MLAKLALITIPLLAACADEGPPTETADPSTVDPSDQTDPPEPGGPIIQRVDWHWTGCGPQANAIPFGLVVTMTVVSPADDYVIKGQAVGCDGFTKNGQIALCAGNPASPARALNVVASDAHGTDMQTIATVDCTDGKWIAP